LRSKMITLLDGAADGWLGPSKVPRRDCECQFR
jgi:hypothetical protein